ncbi:DUF2155 domain-containing protein [Microvirga pudoricolor]|uniref:DUF2155 domain-containing protein n=1 Tax=Microvirga pudoricolor TaxID=2778729 RepID=UPI003899061A
MSFGLKRATLALALMTLGAGAAQADRIKNPTAVFSGLDKITGRIVSFEVAVDETVQFGSLQMTPKVCYTKPPNENPNTSTFVEVDDAGLDGQPKRVFSGWMFASSPGLHGMEHPVYDIWLVDCKGGTQVIAEPKEVPEEPPPIRQEPASARPGSPGQPGDIMAPSPIQQPQAAPQPQPQVQPQRPARRVIQPQQAPVINNERTNDR